MSDDEARNMTLAPDGRWVPAEPLPYTPERHSWPIRLVRWVLGR